MTDLQDKAEKMGIKIPEITFEEINEQIKPVLRKMEQAGIRINVSYINELDQKLSSRLKELETEIHKSTGTEFNIGSPIQMADILFDKLKLSTEGLKKTKSGISTAASELKKIEDTHPAIKLILEHRELSKLISTYLRPLPLLVDEDDRLHTTYGMETSTGRLTSSEPNLQNIPIRGTYGAEIRNSFIANPGMKIIAADYSQIELRIVACLAPDKLMIESFQRGDDIHAKTAAQIFHIPLEEVTKEQRRVAKAVNFGIVYGQTSYGLSQALDISPAEASKYIKEYFESYSGITKYINYMIDSARKDGYVETLFGMKRYLPEINSSKHYIAESEERMAINTPVQGTASEILKLAMIELDKQLDEISKKSGKTARMLLTVHDELVIEASSEIAQEVATATKDTMENVIKICVPIEVSIGIGDTWDEAK
ncbi:MAG: DNA polymerase [Candidatus Berkelbacteria bacterium]